MGMQEFTGKGKAYVITADVPKPTDSRGKGYGSMYTDMRWKIWEQVQKSTMAEMGMDMEIYKMQMQNAAEATQQQRAIVAELKAGALGAQDAMAKNQMDYKQNIVEAAARQRDVRSGRKADVTSYSDKGGDGLGSRGGSSVQETMRLVTDWREGAGATADTETSIAHAVNQIERVVAGGGTKAEGGTIGVDPDDLTGFYEGMTQRLILTELENIRRNEPEFYANAGPDALKEGIRQQIIQTGSAGMIAAASNIDLTDLEEVGVGQTTRRDTSTSYRRDKPVTVIDPEKDYGMGDIKGADYSELIASQEQKLRELERAQAGIVAPNVNLLDRTRDDLARQVGTGGFGAPVRDTRDLGRNLDLEFLNKPFEPYTYEGPASIQNPFLSPPGTEFDPESIKGPRLTPAPAAPPAEEPAEAPEASASTVPSSASSAKVVGAEVPEQKVAIAPDLAKRRNYRAKVLQAGATLAQKPKQFARKYKTGLDAEERRMLVGKHITTVDDLYNTNIQNGSPDAYAATWKELSKALADNPSLLEEAHAYLVAKDMIENQRTT